MSLDPIPRDNTDGSEKFESGSDSGYHAQLSRDRGYHSQHAAGPEHPSETGSSSVDSSTYNRTPHIESLSLSGAAYWGILWRVKQLLDDGADIEESVPRLGRPLQAACANGHVGVVELLLDRGADVDGRADDDRYLMLTPLTIATYAGHLNLVQILWGWNARQSDENGCDDALSFAIAEGHESIVDFLLKSGASITGGCGSPWKAATKRTEHRMLSLLLYAVIERELDGSNDACEIGWALFMANRRKMADYVDRLLDKKKEIFAAFDHDTERGILRCGVEEAVHMHDGDIVRMLIEKGSALLVEKRTIEESDERGFVTIMWNSIKTGCALLSRKWMAEEPKPIIDRRAPTNCDKLCDQEVVAWLLKDHGFNVEEWIHIWKSNEEYEAFQYKVFPKCRSSSSLSVVRVPSDFLFSLMGSIFQSWI